MPEKKVLIVYYSRTGVTEKVAKKLAELLSADIEAITEERDRSGPIQYALCGREALKELEPPINTPSKNAGEYDLIILGTPVWASKISSPLRSYIAFQRDKMNAVAFFCTHQGSGGKGAFRSMEKAVNKAPAAVADFRRKRVLDDEFLPKLDSFINALKDHIDISNG
ncbi:NAD(P)H-dependent oxidoreductase [bacterium]|nr:NAD(P)H-dependent oxidoreductase [bacterium]